MSSFGMRTRGKMRLTNRLAAQLMKTTTELAADLGNISVKLWKNVHERNNICTWSFE